MQYLLSLPALRLRRSEYHVMGIIVKHSVKTITVMSYEDIASEIRLSVATVKKAVRGLEQKGLILLKTEGGGGDNWHEILPPPHLPYENGFITLPRSHPSRPNGYFKKRWPE